MTSDLARSVLMRSGWSQQRSGWSQQGTTSDLSIWCVQHHGHGADVYLTRVA